MTARRAVNESAPLVLIVEQDQSTREMYAEFLAFTGFRVDLAEYADEAVEKARTLRLRRGAAEAVCADDAGCRDSQVSGALTVACVQARRRLRLRVAFSRTRISFSARVKLFNSYSRFSAAPRDSHASE
jgi:CheY-like chemotaxis protein